MSDKPRLGLDIFLALAAIGWADGNLDTDEADAIVRTAIDEGLDLDSIAELEAATKSPVDIGVIDRSGLSKEDRLFVYAVAVWMTRLDGDVSETEKAALAKLGEALKVPEKPRQYAEAIAIEVASLPEGDRPDRYELGKLRAIIADRLHEAQAARAELAAQAAAQAAEQAAAEAATPAEASQSATPDAPADTNGAKESALFGLIRAWVARVIDGRISPFSHAYREGSSR